ncbi:MAG: PhoH family protein [Deltaproteobacteria bacterium]|nr:PhoH family protein [Deltaproteobacteria bacterium]
MARAPSSQRKTYVVDTNVLLHDPNAIFAFEEHEVVLPIVIIEEVDRFKKDLTEVGRNARQISRFLDELRLDHGIPLSQGVPLDGGGSLRVDLCENLEITWSWAGPKSRVDNLLLAVADQLNRKAGQVGLVVVVTKDTNLRIKANALGIRAEDYEHGKVEVDELYTGQNELTVSSELLDSLFADGEAPSEHAEPLAANECLVLRNGERPTQTVLARVGADRSSIQMVKRVKEGVWGIHPRNKEQYFALDLLLDDSIKLVTLVGKAGTGKTLLAIAAGLAKSADERVYHRLLVSRPIFPLGKDIGFLPGDIEDKLNPWMKPVYDNVEFILDSRVSGRSGKNRGYEELISQGLLEIEPLTYIRGRSIPHQYLVVDEAQNLTPHEIKTIITRAGEGTKIVLTGDPYQIDNPYVDSTSNGLVYVVQKFRDQAIAGHVSLSKGERSDLAELAAELL